MSGLTTNKTDKLTTTTGIRTKYVSRTDKCVTITVYLHFQKCSP